MRDYLNFKNKVALVTGSTRGIGKKTAELFAQCGATVYINGREAENVERTIQELKKAGHQADGMAADVGDINELREMFRRIDSRYGRLDVLINNAAVKPTIVQEINDEKMGLEALRVNVLAGINASYEAAKIMKRNDGGSIINMSSVLAVSGSFVYGATHVASKGAVISMTKTLALNLGRFRIRVNAILPSAIATERALSATEVKLRHLSIEQFSFYGREGTPEDVAGVCLFLASEMASYVTGEAISVGGGGFQNH